MSGRFSIQKGKRGERDVAKILNPVLVKVCEEYGIKPWQLARNLKQTQEGGFDLDGVSWLAVEVKWHQVIQGKVTGWWRQCCKQAGPLWADREPGCPTSAPRHEREPVLIYKANGTKWHVRMFMRAEIAPGRRLRFEADISMDNFLIWLARRCAVEAAKEKAYLEAEADKNVVAEVGLFD